MPERTPWETAIEVEPKTESERYLSRLARLAFLSFWCYGNVHTNEGKTTDTGDGKELCDLLVVFGNHILIFSDKHCEYPEHPDALVAWSRWYKRAIDKSVKQLLGAEKFIRDRPDRLFLDKQCTVPFPYRLPNMEEAVIHRIAVTRGSHDAAFAHWGGQSSGSLMIDTGLAGKSEHLESPFTIGWPAGRDRFVHVLDELTLDVLLDEFDTVPDLIAYFSEKERFLNSARYISVPGEEELITLYQTRLHEGRHSLPQDIPDSNMVVLQEGNWEAFNSSAQRAARNAANELSYLWDHIIEYQSSFIRSAETVSVWGNEYTVDQQEELVRALASESRFSRRILATALDGLLHRPVAADQQATRRLPSPSIPGRHYVFTVMGRNTSIDYELYREQRAKFLTTYCCGLRLHHPDTTEVIGLATEPLATEVSSQDFFYGKFPAPATQEELDDVRELCNELGIMQDAAMRATAFIDYEFPEPITPSNPRWPSGSGNRAERRANESHQRRRKGGKRGW